MDHHNDDVLVLPIFGSPMQISGYSDSIDWCRYSSAGCLYWLLDPTTEDAPVVQMAYLDQPCVSFLFVPIIPSFVMFRGPEPSSAS